MVWEQGLAFNEGTDPIPSQYETQSCPAITTSVLANGKGMVPEMRRWFATDYTSLRHIILACRFPTIHQSGTERKGNGSALTEWGRKSISAPDAPSAVRKTKSWWLCSPSCGTIGIDGFRIA